MFPRKIWGWGELPSKNQQDIQFSSLAKSDTVYPRFINVAYRSRIWLTVFLVFNIIFMNTAILKENPRTHRITLETVFIWEESAEVGIKRGGNKPLHLKDTLMPTQKHPVCNPIAPQSIGYSLFRCFPLLQQPIKFITWSVIKNNEQLGVLTKMQVQIKIIVTLSVKENG